MFPTQAEIEDFLTTAGIAFRAQSAPERADFDKRWLGTFAQQVKRSTGGWISDRYRWHGFNGTYQIAQSGKDAFTAYKAQWIAPFVIFDEQSKWSFECSAQAYPDLTPLGADIYVSHHNLKWTMAFTHEQPDIGPFFAHAHNQPSLR